MGKKIKNRSELLSHGHRHSRQTVLDITDAALEELDAYGRIRSFLKCEGNLLRIGDRCWDLDRKRNVYLIGAGKACNAMAMAGGGCAGRAPDRWDRGGQNSGARGPVCAYQGSDWRTSDSQPGRLRGLPGDFGPH